MSTDPSEAKRLLAEIEDPKHRANPHNFGLVEVIAKASKLLTILDQNANQQAEKNLQLSAKIEKLTRGLLVLTVALLFIGVVQLFVAYVAYDLSKATQRAAEKSTHERDENMKGSIPAHDFGKAHTEEAKPK